MFALDSLDAVVAYPREETFIFNSDAQSAIEKWTFLFQVRFA
jgi:hypothetical protein